MPVVAIVAVTVSVLVQRLRRMLKNANHKMSLLSGDLKSVVRCNVAMVRVNSTHVLTLDDCIADCKRGPGCKAVGLVTKHGGKNSE